MAEAFAVVQAHKQLE